MGARGAEFKEFTNGRARLPIGLKPFHRVARVTDDGLSCAY